MCGDGPEGLGSHLLADGSSVSPRLRPTQSVCVLADQRWYTAESDGPLDGLCERPRCFVIIRASQL